MAKPITGDILLEAGTNELEIVEFVICDELYGINVAKVREIIRYPNDIVAIPNQHPSILGVINLRGQVVPIVNLPKHIGRELAVDPTTTRVIVSDFNTFTVGFIVDSVLRIHRLSWESIESPSEVISRGQGSVIAVTKIDDRVVLLLDFEKISSDINPQCGMKEVKEAKEFGEVGFDRSSKTILLAEDSSFIRNMIVNHLNMAKYKSIPTSDGKKAWDTLKAFADAPDFNDIEDHVHLLISDIEMPQMDGLHLIHNVKTHPTLRRLPCIVFSSLITPEMSLKCKSVGANAQITKPEIAGLVKLIDQFVIK